MCLLYLLIVCSFFSYQFVRSDHQSLGCPLSPLDFLTLPSSYLPDSFSSVASISPIFCPGPAPTSPSFCSQLSYLLSMVFLDDLFYLYNSAISTTLIILKSLYPTMTSFQMFKQWFPLYTLHFHLYVQQTPLLKHV